MTREEQIIEASRNPIFKTGLIRLDDISFIAGAQWADKTMLQKILEWLDENFFTGEQEISQYSIEVESILKSTFSSKKEMLQSFKEQFNIE